MSGGHYLRSVTGLSVFTCSLKVSRGKITLMKMKWGYGVTSPNCSIFRLMTQGGLTLSVICPRFAAVILKLP